MIVFSSCLARMLCGDVFEAWFVWFCGVEIALADANRFSGGPALNRGLVLGRGVALVMLVRLGWHKVRKVRGNAADVHDAADIFLYRDSSSAPLLDMTRRFKAVMDPMISHGVNISRSVELTAQWSKILSVGPLYPVVLDDLDAVEGFGLGNFSVTSFMVWWFYRRDEAIRRWRNWLREDPLVHPYKWLRPDYVLPAPFSSVSASSCSSWFWGSF